MSDTNVIVATERMEKRERVPVVAPDVSMIEAIKTIALDPRIDIERMNQLIAMQERLLTRQAEAEFNAAMSAAQAEMGRVAVNAENSQTHSKYATYGAIDQHLRPIYSKHGFALSFDTEAAPIPDMLRIVCMVSHRAGFTRHYHADMPADGKGAKGGDVMTKTHAAGSAMSYGMRYLVKMIFNVAIGEDDDDGNGNGNKAPTITEKQAADLLALATEHRCNLPRLLNHWGIQSLSEILATNFEAACAEIRAVAARRASARQSETR